VQPCAPSGWNIPEVKRADVCLRAATEIISKMPIADCPLPIANFENSEIGKLAISS
jgi:hypothetical protein